MPLAIRPYERDSDDSMDELPCGGICNLVVYVYV
jgi:hypothetical protein